MEMMKKLMGQVATVILGHPKQAPERLLRDIPPTVPSQGPVDSESGPLPISKPSRLLRCHAIPDPAQSDVRPRKLYDEMKKIMAFLKTVTTMKMMGTEMKTTKVVLNREGSKFPPPFLKSRPGYKLGEGETGLGRICCGFHGFHRWKRLESVMDLESAALDIFAARLPT